MKESSPFGSRSRTRILLALSRLEFSYPRALARRLESPIFALRKALDGLERDGLVTSRLVGRTRVYRLDPFYVAYKELAAYLARLASAESEAGAGADAPSPAALPSAPMIGRLEELREGQAEGGGPGRGKRHVSRPDPGGGWRNW